MDINSLKSLKKNGSVFELYTEVIANNNPYAVFKFPCTERHNMRMDLVCYDIYNNTSNIDVITTVNGIMQPLTVQDGDIIYFVDEKDLDSVRSDAAVIASIIDAVKGANKGKEQKTDSGRTADTANRKQTERDKSYVPPNILQSNNKNIDFGEGTIILRPNF